MAGTDIPGQMFTNISPQRFEGVASAPAAAWTTAPCPIRLHALLACRWAVRCQLLLDHG